MSYRDELKLKLPVYQQGNVELDEFLEAIGELLDGFKSAIDNFQTYNDFQLIDESLIDDLAKQFDVVFPRNMSEERRRSYLREIVTLYRSKGTTGSMQRIFRIIGWEVTIEEYFIIDPSWFADPADTYTITNEVGASYTLGLYDRLSEGQLIYKNSQVFVDLVDPVGNVYNKRQIYGQNYQVSDDITFMKVPYVKIIVKSEDFDLFTASYVEEGKLYSYESSEEFEILESIKNYFIDRNRPANVAIIDISTPFTLEDTFTETVIELNGSGSFVDGDIDFLAVDNSITITSGGLFFDDPLIPSGYVLGTEITTWYSYGFKEGDVITITDSASNDGQYKIFSIDDDTAYLYITNTVVDEVSTVIDITNWYYGAMTTSDKLPKYDGTIAYGATVDRYISGESFGGFTYGEPTFDYYGVGDIAPAESFTLTHTVADGITNPSNSFPIRKNTTLTLNQPADRAMSLYATYSDLFEVEAGTATWEQQIFIYGALSNEVITLDGYRAFYVRAFVVGVTGDLTIDVDLLD